MDLQVSKAGTIYQKPAQAIGLSTPPIGCVLDLPGLPGAGNKIYDRSPYGNIGTITGAVWTRLPSGLWVLDFDGADDTIDCGSASSLNITGSITIELWLQLSVKDLMQNIVEKQVTWRTDGFAFRLKADNTLQFVTSGAGENDVAGTTELTTGIPYHIAVIQNGTTQTNILLNGKVDGTQESPGELTTSTDPLTIGDSAHIADRDFNGLIALFRVYNRALSALEIQNSFRREKYLFGVV